MSNLELLNKNAADIAIKSKAIAEDAAKISDNIKNMLLDGSLSSGGVDPLIFAITIFVLACFVGYYVVWSVTPALHTPLMSVTNAISSIVIIGAIIAVGPVGFGISQIIGFLAVIIAAINIFGGFMVTQRMLEMFRKK